MIDVLDETQPGLAQLQQIRRAGQEHRDAQRLDHALDRRDDRVHAVLRRDEKGPRHRTGIGAKRNAFGYFQAVAQPAGADHHAVGQGVAREDDAVGRRRAEIGQHGHVLTPGRYVGAEEVEDNDEDFTTKMQQLTEKLGEQMAKGTELDQLIRQKLGGLGYEF